MGIGEDEFKDVLEDVLEDGRRKLVEAGKRRGQFILQTIYSLDHGDGGKFIQKQKFF
jgi:hypothetical protein